MLLEDKAQRRFSIVSFDRDVEENVRTVSAQVRQSNIIGVVIAYAPDFEFANFSLDELVEVAARLDESYGVSGDAVRATDWNGVGSGSDFVSLYRKVSERSPRGLKGEEWGGALGRYAKEYPHRSDTGEERPFWKARRIALQARGAHYDTQVSHTKIDPDTFENVPVR